MLREEFRAVINTYVGRFNLTYLTEHSGRHLDKYYFENLRICLLLDGRKAFIRFYHCHEEYPFIFKWKRSYMEYTRIADKLYHDRYYNSDRKFEQIFMKHFLDILALDSDNYIGNKYNLK